MTSPPQEPTTQSVSADASSRAALVQALRTYSVTMDAYIASMSQAHGLHRTDLNALAVVMDQTNRGHRVTPRDLGATVNLSTSATSSMLDRLERAGHITRRQHPHDRRSVVVEITELALQTGGRIFGQLGGATEGLMNRYSDEDIAVVVRFLEELNDVIRSIATAPDGASQRPTR